MAYYPNYNKGKKTKKAFTGAMVGAGLEVLKGVGGLIAGSKRAKDAKTALGNFDTNSLKLKGSKSLKKLADEPISQEYIEGLEESRAVDNASAMNTLIKDPRNALAGLKTLNRSASKERLSILGKQSDAKTNALNKLGAEEGKIEGYRAGLAGQELSGIKGELNAARELQMGGIDALTGAATSLAGGIKKGKKSFTPNPDLMGDAPSSPSVNLLDGVTFKEGGKIAEDGGVTPDEFNHDSNPIDLVQDGEKIGEATGGELILPPDDVKAIEESIQQGDKEAAFELMKSLVEKYKENEMNSEAKEGPPKEAKEGGYLGKLRAKMGSLVKSSIKY